MRASHDERGVAQVQMIGVWGCCAAMRVVLRVDSQVVLLCIVGMAHGGSKSSFRLSVFGRLLKTGPQERLLRTLPPLCHLLVRALESTVVQPRLVHACLS